MAKNKFGGRSSVDGLRELGAAIRELTDDMQKRTANAAVKDGAAVVLAAAKTTSKFVDRSGNLRAAIASQKQRKTALTAAHIVGVRSGGGFRSGDIKGGKTEDVKAAKKGDGPLGVDAYYWRFLEFGTVNITPRPFLGPALESNIQRVNSAVSERIASRIKYYKTKGPKK